MKRHILLFAFLLCSAGRIGAQDSGSNWIKTRTAISETGTTITDITYYNGLGLPSQTTNVRASVNGYNIVTPIVYDALLRSDATAYLPFEATYYSDEEELPNSTAISEQRNYYEERYSSDYERSFTEKVYEASPLGRVRKQALPGYMKDYEVLYTEFDYRTNDTDEVRWLAVGVDGELVCEGCHDAGTLSCTVTTDPDDHVVQSFTDGLGRTLLSRTFDDDEPIDTYSVYDDYGRLRWVVTPEGSYLLSDSLTVPVDDDFAEKYCYVYTYNDRGLMVEKRMPGREAEYMRYDEGDRLRVSQDGNLRAKKQWISYSYDALGRVQEQSLAVEAELIPIRSQAGVSIGEPIESVEPPYLGSSVPLRKYVYDTYPSEVQAAGLDFQSIEGLTATDGESLRYDNATGSLTYEKLAVLANDTITGYHQRACYYDYKGRLIQIVERDTEDGILCTSKRYDFVGNLIAQRESYTRAGKTDDIDRTFTYDDRSRLLRETTQVNGGELAVVAYSYDAVGQLSGKTYGTGTHAIHETMEYNIQGWLTAKNSELFDMSLDYYNKWGHIDDVSPSYTGNITSWQWQHKKVDGTADADERAYRYRYDDLSRLTAAEPFSSTSSLHTDWSTEKGITYDRNGNILTLTRTGSSGAVSQSYRFEYVGNQRKKTMNGSGVYTYDANGNMTEDALTGFGISYNLLNLPENLQDHWGSGEISHRYSYLADGTKKTVGDYENYGYRYVGSLVYHWRYDAIDSFESTSFGGGRIVGTDSGSEVHYFLTDHLGSTRVVAKVTPTERIDLDRKDYYPFGKTWEQPDMPASDNRYTFSGKEFQQTYSSSALYLDFGARFYDPDGVVFIQQDPLLEKYYSIGQYNYCAGNPVNRIDHNGAEWYSYQEEYEDGNGEIRTRTSYKYVNGVMSEREMQEGGYTYLGVTYDTGDTYYSLSGAEIPYVTGISIQSKEQQQKTQKSQKRKNKKINKVIESLKFVSGTGGTLSTAASLYDKPLTFGSEYIIINEGGTIVRNTNRVYTSTGKIATNIGTGIFYASVFTDIAGFATGGQTAGETAGNIAINTIIWRVGMKSPQTALATGLALMIFAPVPPAIVGSGGPAIIAPDNTRIIKTYPIH